MLERIRTFFGRIVGLHQDKRTVVVQGEMWRCTKCHLLFLTRKEGDCHNCLENN